MTIAWPWMSVDQWADHFGISRAAVRWCIESGQLVAYRRGKADPLVDVPEEIDWTPPADLPDEAWFWLRAVQKARGRPRREWGGAGASSPEALFQRIAYYGFRCYMCGELFECVDHVIPLVRNGPNWPANQRPACWTCNSRKWRHGPTITRPPSRPRLP